MNPADSATLNSVLANYRDEHAKLLAQWSAAVGLPGYDKQPWMDREEGMNLRYRSKLSALGYTGPLLVASDTSGVRVRE